MIGNIATIDDAIEALKNNGLVLKIVEGLQDYLSCKIKFSNYKKHAWLGQPHLIKNLEKKFGGLVEEIWRHKTPSTPKFLIVRPTEENEKISTKDQRDYQSVKGILLYLVKHSYPNLVSTTREMSKVNDSANPVAYKKLLCVIKYVTDTKNIGLKIEPMWNSKKPWEIVCFSASDYAGDLVSRQSVSGSIYMY